MEPRDSIGRRRQPSQNSGLRPLHPALPHGMVSRAVRIAMTEQAWEALRALIESEHVLTAPRALGRVLERAIEHEPQSNVTDWQDWQIRKERQLLERKQEAS